MGGRGPVGARGVIPNSSPEASTGGRFFDLSAHARRRVWCRAEGSWLGGVVGGRGRDPCPEPPLVPFWVGLVPQWGACWEFRGKRSGGEVDLPWQSRYDAIERCARGAVALSYLSLVKKEDDSADD